MTATSVWAQQSVRPTITTGTDTLWYTISTPNRAHYTLTNQGEGQYVTGEDETMANNQLWCLLPVPAVSTGGAMDRFLLYNRGTRTFLSERRQNKGDGLYFVAVPRTTTFAKGFALSAHSSGLFNLTDADGNMLNQCLPSEKKRLTVYSVANDAGNLFLFTRVDNLEQAALLAARKKAEAVLNNTSEGQDPGQYSAEARNTLRQAIDQSQTAEKLELAIQTYKTSMLEVQPHKYYYLQSASSDERGGQVIYATSATAGRVMRFADKTLDSNAQWVFEPTDDGEAYWLKNVGTALYAKIPSNDGGLVLAVDKQQATAVKLQSLGSGAQWNIVTRVGNQMIHCQRDFHHVVMWNDASLSSGSAFQLRTVTDDEMMQTRALKDKELLYKEVWRDDFDTDGTPNPDNWGYERGFVRNRELQWYQPDNATVRDGQLVITGRKESVVNPNYDASSGDWRRNRQQADYTSASLNTSGKHDWLYGRFTIKATIPTSGGAWPAIWFLGNERVTGPWPNSGEIDLLEYYSGKILGNVVWGNGSSSGAWSTGGGGQPLRYWTDQNANWVNEPHVWRMDWTEEAIKLYVDDELINATHLSRTINSGGGAKVVNPYTTKQYILLNLAMGSNGGAIDESKLPMVYKVDYVKVEQRDEATQVVTLKEPTAPVGKVKGGRGHLTFVAPGRACVATVAGTLVWQGIAQAGQTLSLPAGCYVANGQKVIVR